MEKKDGLSLEIKMIMIEIFGVVALTNDHITYRFAM